MTMVLDKIHKIPGFDNCPSIYNAISCIVCEWDDLTKDQKDSLYNLALELAESETYKGKSIDEFIDAVFDKFMGDHPEYQKEVKEALDELLSPSPLSQFSDEQLQQELEKRSQAKTQRPQPLEVNAEEAIAAMKCFLDKIISETIETGYWDIDNNDCLYQKYCETFYGVNFWSWKRKFPEE